MLDCEWQKHKFTLIDTGGIDPLSDDPLLKQMRRQAEIAIETCDVILFFVDGRHGLDRRRSRTWPTCCASSGQARDAGGQQDRSTSASMDNIYDFYNLGHGRSHRHILGEPAEPGGPAGRAVQLFFPGSGCRGSRKQAAIQHGRGGQAQRGQKLRWSTACWARSG